MSEQRHTVTRRILALARYPEQEAPELEWIDNELASIDSRDGTLADQFLKAVHRLQTMIDDGTLIVVREEEVP